MSKLTVAYERCPHCKAAIELHLRDVWDYQEEFDTECPECGKAFGVDVVSNPSFRCSSKTNAELEREAWERARAKQ